MIMDNIKHFTKIEKELENLTQAVRIHSQYIGTEFGIEKCTMLIIKRRNKSLKEIELQNQDKIRTLGEKET